MRAYTNQLHVGILLCASIGASFTAGAIGGSLLAGYVIKRLARSEHNLVDLVIKSLVILGMLVGLLVAAVFLVQCNVAPFVGLTTTSMDGSGYHNNRFATILSFRQYT